MMFYLKRNLPYGERIFRIAGGVVAAMLLWLLPSAGIWFWVVLMGAVTLVLTGLVAFCPACALIGRKPLEQLK